MGIVFAGLDISGKFSVEVTVIPPMIIESKGEQDIPLTFAGETNVFMPGEDVAVPIEFNSISEIKTFLVVDDADIPVDVIPDENKAFFTSTDLSVPIEIKSALTMFGTQTESTLPVEFVPSPILLPFISSGEQSVPIEFEQIIPGQFNTNIEAEVPVDFIGNLYTVPAVSVSTGLLGNESTGNLSTMTQITAGTVMSTEGVSFASSAMLFNTTSGGYVDIAQSNYSATQTSWTAEAWINPTLAGRRIFLIHATPPVSDAYAGVRLQSTVDSSNFGITMLANTGPTLGWSLGTSITSSHRYALNQWHHIAVTYTLNDRVRVYVNGVFRFQTPYAVTVMRTGRHMLGAGSRNGGGYELSGNRFTGNMQDFRYYENYIKYRHDFTPPPRGTE